MARAHRIRLGIVPRTIHMILAIWAWPPSLAARAAATGLVLRASLCTVLAVHVLGTAAATASLGSISFSGEHASNQASNGQVEPADSDVIGKAGTSSSDSTQDIATPRSIASDLGLLAGLDRDVGYAILVRGLADALDDPTGNATLAMLRDSAMFESSRRAWRALADELGMSSQDAFAELFSRRALLVLGRDALQDADPMRWSLAIEVSEPIAMRLRRRLAAVPRGLDDGIPVMQLAEESVRVLWMNAPLGVQTFDGSSKRTHGSETKRPATERVVTLVLSPAGEDALAKSILFAHASQASLVSVSGVQGYVSPMLAGRSWPTLLGPIASERSSTVLIRTPTQAGCVSRTETGWLARMVSKSEPGQSVLPTLWATDVLDALDTSTLAAFVGSPAAFGLAMDPAVDRPDASLSPAALVGPLPAGMLIGATDRQETDAGGWAGTLGRLLDPARALLAAQVSSPGLDIEPASHDILDTNAAADLRQRQQAHRLDLHVPRMALTLQVRSQTSNADAASASESADAARSAAHEQAQPDHIKPTSLVLSVGVERESPESPRGFAWSVSSRPALTGAVSPSQPRIASLPPEVFAPHDMNRAAAGLGGTLTRLPGRLAHVRAHDEPSGHFPDPMPAPMQSLMAAPMQAASESVHVPFATAVPEAGAAGSSRPLAVPAAASGVRLVSAGSVRPALLMDILGTAGPLSSTTLGSLRWLDHVRWVTTFNDAASGAKSGATSMQGLMVTDLAVDLSAHVQEGAGAAPAREPRDTSMPRGPAPSRADH